MNSILRVRDSATGEWINIPALVGPQGEPGQSGVYFGKEEPTDENVNVWVRDTDNSDNVLNFVSYTPQTLTPEQQAQARQNIGVATAPETAGKWELIASGTMEEEARGIELTLDNDGKPFELTKAALHVTNIHRGTEMTGDISCHATLGSAFWSAGTVSAKAEQYTNHREFIAYANTNGSAWLAVRESENASRGPMIRPFSDFIGKTFTKADFLCSAAHLKLAAGLTYELWGVRK